MTRRIARVALLTGVNEAPLLSRILRAHNASLEIVPLHDRGAVDALDLAGPHLTRLVSVCSPVIVPAAVLARLPGPAYNFHPGPPTRPGRYPSIFALYEGDRRFGITVHEMAAKVDSGAIVATDAFEVPADGGLAALETLTMQRIFVLFDRLASHLAVRADPLPQVDAAWSGRKTTFAQATALARITPELSAEEIARRRHACGGQVTDLRDPGWIDTE